MQIDKQYKLRFLFQLILFCVYHLIKSNDIKLLKTKGHIPVLQKFANPITTYTKILCS